MFALLIKDIIPALFDPSSPYNTQHAYVLQSLAEVKSIALALDLSSAEQLLQYLFSSIFDGISGKSKGGTGDRIAKDVELNMTEILKTAIEETDVLPTKVVDIIMAQFLRAAAGKEKAGTAAIGPNQTTLAIKEEPRAYGMAKTLCNSCPDKMARQVSQYFSDVILEASGVANRSNGHKSKDDDDGAGGPSEDDLKDLRKAHQLLRELWRAAPALLQNVIPQIELELVADHVDVRLLATETLGDMIAGIGAAGPPPPPLLDPTAYPPVKLMDAAASASSTPSSILTTPISPQSFAQTHSTAYQGFVSRRNDKNASIRAAWTIAAGYIVSTSAGGIGLGREDEADLIRSLGDKLNDTDEKVRLAAVKAIESFSFRDIVEKLGAEGGLDKPGSILSSLADRSRDRKPAVRIEGMALLAKLWAVGAGEMAAGQEAVVAALSGIPSRIIGGFYANDKEYNLLMDRVMFECLIPLGFPAQKQKTTANGKAASISSFDQDNIRAARVLLFTHMLDAHSKKAFFAMQARQPQYAAVMLKFLDLCDAYNGGVASKKDGEQVKRLDQTVTYLSQFFPDGERTRADLLKFAKLNDRRNYQLIRYAVAPEYDFKTVYRAIKELSKRLKDGAHASLLETLIPLLYRSSCLLFNKSHFQTFIEHAKNDRDGLGATAHEILNEISQRNPDIFKTHVGELCKGLTASPPTADKQNDAADVETLRAIATYSRRSADDLPQDRRFVQTLIAYGLYGQPAKASKYAVNIILSRKDEEGMKAATDLLNRTMVDFTYGSKNFLNKLYTIGQLELLAPTVTRHVDDAILDMALKQILSTNRQDAGDEPEDAWVEDADLDEECQAKCLALKILVNRLRSEEDVDEARTHTAPTLKLLRQLIDKRGEFVKSKPTPPHIRSRLLLLAAQLTLKLCMKKHFDELLTPVDFDRLALVTQDAVPQVRKRFVERLQKYLAAKRLPLRFYAIVFLTAYEPDPASKAQTETWIRSRARDFAAQAQASGGAATNVMEAMITRLISLLAHHPDFGLDEEDLLPHARYIVYYLANVATEQNLGVIVKFVERVKQTQDAVYPDKSDRIYAVCDLAMAVIRRWQARKNWALSVYPGKVGLPVGLYAKLSSHQEAQDIAEKQYIPEGIEDQLDDMLRSSEKKKVCVVVSLIKSTGTTS